MKTKQLWTFRPILLLGMSVARVVVFAVALGSGTALGAAPQGQLRGEPTFIPANTPAGPTGSVTVSGELVHGFELLGDFADGLDDVYRISQKPYSSYEVVVDATSGDIQPLRLDRFGTSGFPIQFSVPVGTGQSRSLRWFQIPIPPATAIDDQTVRVRSDGCTTDCGPDDVYRLRAYETTYAIPRFNNSGSQITILVLQNPTDYHINGFVSFWSETGANLGGVFVELDPKAQFVLNTARFIAGAGSATIIHDGRYGDLFGKAVALDPATGFSFDTPAVPRIH